MKIYIISKKEAFIKISKKVATWNGHKQPAKKLNVIQGLLHTTLIARRQKSLNNPKQKQKKSKEKLLKISQGILIIQQKLVKQPVKVWGQQSLMISPKIYLHRKNSFVRVNLTPPIYRTLGCADDMIIII